MRSAVSKCHVAWTAHARSSASLAIPASSEEAGRAFPPQKPWGIHFFSETVVP